MPDFKNTVGGRFLTMLEAQAPANFAMVMSTGIVSVALHLLDYPIGARLLFWLNAALCVGLALLYIIRLFVFPKRFVQDFRSHGAGPGFLTVVAGICILGNQFVLLGEDPAMGEAVLDRERPVDRDFVGRVLLRVLRRTQAAAGKRH